MEVEGGAGWSAMALMCKSSTSFGRREDKWGEEDQWLNFRSFRFFPILQVLGFLCFLGLLGF